MGGVVRESFVFSAWFPAVVGSNALQVTQMSKKLNFSGNEYFSRSFFKAVILLLLD